MATLDAPNGDKVLLGHSCLIGRLPSCQLRVDDPDVSALHAMIRWDGAVWLIRDLASTNGTYLDGAALPANTDRPLASGSRLSFGRGGRVWTLQQAGPVRKLSREWKLTLPPAALPACGLTIYVSTDARVVDIEVTSPDRGPVPLGLDHQSALLVAQLEETFRRDSHEGAPPEECGWIQVEDTAQALGAARQRVEAWLDSVKTCLAASNVVGADSLLEWRAEMREVRLAKGCASRVGSPVTVPMAPSSGMTALERSLYQNPPVGLVNLTYGYPEAQNPEWIEEIVRAPLARGGTRSEHRTNVEGYFRRLFGLEEVLLTATASEALLVAIRTAVSVGGNEVVVLESGFDAYPGLIETCGAVPRFAARLRSGHLSAALVAEEIGPRTSAVLITSPDNPTGVIHSSEALAEVASRCAARRIPLILDAVFQEVAPFGRSPAAPLQWAPASLDLMVVGDTGKILGLDGTKLGALLTSTSLHDRVVSVADNLFFQVADYKLAIFSRVLADARYPAYLRGFLDVLARNQRALHDGVGPFVRLLPSEATSMALLDVADTGVGGSTFAQRLLHEECVATIPCSMFARGARRPLDNLIRLSMARPATQIEDAARRIARLAKRIHDAQ